MERQDLAEDDALTVRELRRRRAHRRAGMTLIEVIFAIVIMSGAMLGLAAFSRKFQRSTTDATVTALASDLAVRRLEEIKGYTVYSTLVATYNGTTETFTSDPGYTGFSRATAAVRCSGCPNGVNDYITVTVTISGRSLATPLAKTTVIANF